MNSNPKLRNAIFIEILSVSKEAITKTIENNSKFDFPFKNCINCCHFREADEQCLHWHSRPPARVICYGCENHTDLNSVPY